MDIEEASAYPIPDDQPIHVRHVPVPHTPLKNKTKNTQQQQQKAFTWTEPFDGLTWLSIALHIVFAGSVLWLLEKGKGDDFVEVNPTGLQLPARLLAFPPFSHKYREQFEHLCWH